MKGKFVIQSAPDIRRKLQKLAIGPESTSGNLLKVATLVFYNRGQEEAEERKVQEGRRPWLWLWNLRGQYNN